MTRELKWCTRKYLHNTKEVMEKMMNKKEQKTNNTVDINPTLSAITLDVKRFNIPIKRQRLAK